jgi:hypothetical protein
MGRITDDHQGRAIKARLEHREHVARFEVALRDPETPIESVMDILLEADEPGFAEGARRSSSFRGALEAMRHEAIEDSK